MKENCLMPPQGYICTRVRIKDAGPADGGFPADDMGRRFADAAIGSEIPVAVVLLRPPQPDAI